MKVKRGEVPLAKLNENTKRYLEQFYSGPKIQSFDPWVVKNKMAVTTTHQQQNLPDIYQFEDRWIKTKDGQELRIRVYIPEGEGPFPVLVYYHGGGWVLGSIEMFEVANRLIVMEGKIVVVSVDYRLAPEYPYPIPLEDAYTAFEWVANHTTDIHGDPTKISVGGDSAGGNLATVVAKRALDQGGPQIHSQILIYPVTNLNFQTPSYDQFAEGYGLDRELMQWFAFQYTLDIPLFKHPTVSPLLNETLKGLPPTLIVAAQMDVLLDEGQAYAEKLRRDGVLVQYELIPGVVHGFYSMMPFFLEETKQVVEKINNFIQTIHHDCHVQ